MKQILTFSCLPLEYSKLLCEGAGGGSVGCWGRGLGVVLGVERGSCGVVLGVGEGLKEVVLGVRGGAEVVVLGVGGGAKGMVLGVRGGPGGVVLGVRGGARCVGAGGAELQASGLCVCGKLLRWSADQAVM